MTSGTPYDRILRNLEREVSHYERDLAKLQQPKKPPAPLPTAYFLSNVPSKPLGHLTLLDAASGSGLSLVALSLAACVSSGSPLPDGTPTQQGNVILFAAYDFPTDTLKPRLQAASGDPGHIVLLRPLVQDASLALTPTRSLAFPQDLDHLASIIRTYPSSQSPPLATSPQSDVPAVPAVPATDPTTSTISTVPCIPNPAHNTSQIAQKHIDTSPASLESAPKGNGIS